MSARQREPFDIRRPLSTMTHDELVASLRATREAYAAGADIITSVDRARTTFRELGQPEPDWLSDPRVTGVEVRPSDNIIRPICEGEA